MTPHLPVGAGSAYPTQPERWFQPVPPSYAELLQIVQDLQRRVAALEAVLRMAQDAAQDATAPHGAPQSDQVEILYLETIERPF